MRSTSVKVSVSTAIVVVLLSAAPLEAAQRRESASARRESQVMRAVQTIRQAVARTFGIIAQALPTIPIPGTTTEAQSKPTSPLLLPADGDN